MSAQRLIHRIDCTLEHPPERYFQNGDVRVVERPAGTYREAEAVPLSRFGYRFCVERVGHPHRLIVRYPDDRQRFMCVVDGTGYDLSAGVVTGSPYPLSGRMLTFTEEFWPRWNDCSVTFMTWGHGEPAGVAEIEIYELAELPPMQIAEPPGGGRVIGVEYEDPCGMTASEGALTREEWTEHVISYLRHTGQSVLAYPLAWYHGPQYPSECEPADDFEVVLGRDRKQYVRWTTRPSEWVTPLLDSLHDAGIGFRGSLTLLRLGSLMEQMNTDLDAIKAGADTINSMLWCDRVQEGTQDWTPVYNVQNYPERIRRNEGVSAGEFPYAYGEKTGCGYHPGPISNPLHPDVQKAILRFITEIGARYGSHPAFKGINLNLWAPTITWFGSIHSGYDDYTVGEFERDTGIEIPVDPKAHDRFSRRYEFLTYVCRDIWVSWRCGRIADLIRKMRDALQSGGDDLTLTLNAWAEPYIPAIVGSGGAQHQLGARKSTVGLYREAGLDPTLLRDEPGIELSLEIDGGNRDRGSSMNEDAVLETFTMFRDHDFLDSETLDAFADQTRPGAFIFNCWHEAWGDHRWFSCDPDDQQAKELAFFGVEPAEGIFRINSVYPDDGFWWDSQLRITPAFPASDYLEQYAHAIAEFDALTITRGGLFLDKAHTPELQRFAAAYRALPNVRFETIGHSTDPVAVRTLVHDGVRYLYVVNRERWDLHVSIEGIGEMTDLVTGECISDSIALGPYELWSFTMSADVEITGFDADVPADVLDRLRRDQERVLTAMATARGKGFSIPGADIIGPGIRAALDDGRIAWLRRALTGYTARKALELVGSEDTPLSIIQPETIGNR
jgi:hypothetical protein